MDNFILAQVMGLIALILSLLAISQPNRVRYIIFNILQVICSGIQYILLNKHIAFYLCVASVIRLVIYYHKDKYSKGANILILLLFIAIHITTTALTYESILDIFPAMATILVAYTVWQGNIYVIKIGCLVAKTLWGIFALVTRAYFSVIMDIIIIIWTIIVLYRMFKEKSKNNILNDN